MLFDAQRPTLVSTNPPLLVRSQPPTVNRPPPGGASPPLRTILAAMVVAAAMAPRPCSAETYRLEADRKADRVVRVKVVYEVDGQLKLNADGKKVSRLPIDVRAELSYDERLVAADVAPEWAGHSVRHYYQAKANLEKAGIAGLVPKKPGPRGPHKIQGEVLAFLKKRLVPGEPIRARALAKLIRKEFGVEVHPRTIERVVRGKKTPR